MTKILQLKQLLAITGAAATAMMLTISAVAAEPVTFVSFGGSFQDALRKALFDPAAKRLGVEIHEDTMNGVADIRLQVDSGNVTWDLVNPGGTDCVQGAAEGLYEPLDYSVLTNAEGIPDKLKGDYWVASTYYALVLAWNREKYGDNPPKSWADFFDVEAFPGRRAVYWRPAYVMEAALLADGVAADKIYPIDVDRAINKMKTLGDNVVMFWKSGGQTVQLAKDKEADMLMMWNGRAATAVDEDLGYDYTFNQSILNFDCWAIPKGSKNKDQAMKVLNEILSPDLMANLPQYITYGPAQSRAFDTGKIDAKTAKILPSSPENLAKSMLLDNEFWLKNREEIEKRWNEVKAE